MAKRRGVDPMVLVLEHYSVVFLGEASTTVKEVFSTKGKEDFISKTSTVFEISRVLKGNLDNEAVIHGGAPCGCNYDFKPGVRYLVVASKSEEKFIAGGCKYIKEASPEIIDLYEELAKQAMGTP